MMMDTKHSINSHERHVFSGVTVARTTRSVAKTREMKFEGVSKSQVNGRLNSAEEKKSSADFKCQHCSRCFTTAVGLSVHITRWCKLKPSGAGGAIPPLAAHDTFNSSAQNHQSVLWSYARTHLESKRPGEILKTVQTRPRLKFPNSSNRKKWKILDDLIFTKVVTSISDSEFRNGNPDDVLRKFTDIVYETAATVCDVQQEKKKVANGIDEQKQRQPALLHKLKMAKRNARRELRHAKKHGGDFKSAHKSLMSAVRAHHDLLKAISKDKKARNRVAECSRFLQDPHKYAKRLLSPPVTGKPAFPKVLADTYFSETYSDSNRAHWYMPPFDVPRPADPLHPFDENFASFEEFSDICQKKSNGSAPGLNGIPYLMYKRCNQVRKLLWRLLCRIWVARVIPLTFQVGRIRLLPKSSDTSHPRLMRPISILNSEGRLFWSVFQKRLSKYLLDNNYIQKNIQKGFLEGVAGCIEHTTAQWEMLQHAKRKSQQIVVAWLDLENAYGSVRHMLVQFALKWYHIPMAISELVFRYYDTIFLKVVTEDWSSEYFHLAIGVPQGCTASTIMFDLCFQVVIDIWKWRTRDAKPHYSIDNMIPFSCAAYADDIKLIASRTQDCQKSVDAFQCALDWTETLKAKPAKCRALAFRLFRKREKTIFKKVLATDYSSFDPLLKINGVSIKFIGDDDPPIFKYLGRYLQYNLNDDIIVSQVEEKIQNWLKLIDDTPLEGRMKAWIVNMHVCAKLAWLLMIQNFFNRDVERWSSYIHAKYRKWVGLAKSAEPSILYRSNEHFGLNFKDVVQMKKQLEVVKWHILKYSKDEQVQQVYKYRLCLDQKGHIGRGNRTSPCLTLERLEREQELDRFSMMGQHGRHGLGLRYKYRKVEPREAIIERMKKEAEEKRMIILHQYEMQTSWLSWGLDKMMFGDLSWRAILTQYSSRLLKFLVGTQTNTLPTPDNLRRWNQNRDAVCGLCGQKWATLSHVLAGCPWVRNTENKLSREDRYTWRHNNLLAMIAAALKEQVEMVNKQPDQNVRNRLINFISAGQRKPSTRSVSASGLLAQANDWTLQFDLPEQRLPGSRYTFPHDVCVTTLKIDGHIVSRKKRVCIGLELTVPMEENVSKWHTLKTTKYDELVFEAKKNNWRVYTVVLEVGAKGWIPSSTMSALSSLGLQSPKDLCDRLSHAALKSSYVIWINRFNQSFQPWRLSTGKLT